MAGLSTVRGRSVKIDYVFKRLLCSELKCNIDKYTSRAVPVPHHVLPPANLRGTMILTEHVGTMVALLETPDMR